MAALPPIDTAAKQATLHQMLRLTTPEGQTAAVPLAALDAALHMMGAIAVNFGSQLGACAMLLVLVLAMTSRKRFGRASLLVNVAGLVVCLVRRVLSVLYFTSTYAELYVQATQDARFVDGSDARISAAATLLAVPQLALVEAALLLQAWSMLQLWPAAWRTAVAGVSVVVAVAAVAFALTSAVLFARSTLDPAAAAAAGTEADATWLRQCNLAFSTTTIFWFCLVFISRLLLHMWEYRSVLPPAGGLSAMEVLVMTNGVLMLVPVLFAALEFGRFANFEPASLSLTSVVIVLPMGTLIAQHVTRHHRRQRSAGSRTTGASRSSGGRSGVYKASRSTDTGSKRRLFGSWSRESDASTAIAGVGTQVHVRGGGGGDLSLKKDRPVLDAVDQELQRIDGATDVEQGCGVRVDREVDVRRSAV